MKKPDTFYSDAEKEELWELDSSFKNAPSYKNYQDLRNAILKDKKLQRKDKELILMAIYAAKKYEDGMFYYCLAALEHGATIEEIAEVFEACIISRGTGMWIEGRKAIEHAKRYKNIDEISYQTVSDINFENIEECKDYLMKEYTELPEWVSLMEKYNEEALMHYSQLRINSLNDNRLSKKFKELVLIGINVSESYSHGIKVHTNVARRLGADEEEISEVLLSALLTSGGPAWIDGSKYLK